FTNTLIALRKSHPVFAQRKFLHGNPLPGHAEDLKDILWLRPDGESMGQADWHEADPKTVALVLSDHTGKRFVVFINAFSQAMEYRLPASLAALPWSLLVNTADGSAFADLSGPHLDTPVMVPERSLVAAVSRTPAPAAP
ncbi:MAG: hypothetical protein AAF615_10210, partial [Pseudomonadota bacterium]